MISIVMIIFIPFSYTCSWGKWNDLGIAVESSAEYSYFLMKYMIPIINCYPITHKFKLISACYMTNSLLFCVERYWKVYVKKQGCYLYRENTNPCYSILNEKNSSAFS